ncbi:hypothetical protein [Devosia nitrariae]|uniref:Uncharacterized protein n=1 Tax=Devosia nitrariae TaxID=2071872 RepID=A0ABQ5WBL8_9HYPH|nr:hypothetical protein [Devosia nitrariae]GLQ57232.1 hypothetical protein GCM10010862_44910 [Devosia nitrariae]
MLNIKLIPFIASGLLALLFILVWLVGWLIIVPVEDVVVSSDATSLELSQSTTRLLTAVDQSVTMITGLIFGLFVLVGFAISRSDRHFSSFNAWDRSAGALFLIFVFLAVYLGHAARIQAVVHLPKPYDEVEAIKLLEVALSANLGRQAFCAGLAAVFAIFLALRAIVDKGGVARDDAIVFPIIVTVHAGGKVAVSPKEALEQGG